MIRRFLINKTADGLLRISSMSIAFSEHCKNAALWLLLSRWGRKAR